jgi:sugar lactone lactonase YvrE
MKGIQMSNNLELIVDSHSILGEGAVWSSDRKVLYWVDIDGCYVHAYDPATGRNLSVLLNQRVGTVVPRTFGGVSVALHHGFANLDLDTGWVSYITDPEETSPNRFNDGKCDPAGRFWAGTMPFDDGAPDDGGVLWCLYADGHTEKKVDAVQCSNGIAWGLDNSTMYYIDTPTAEVRAYDYNNATGEIDNARTVVSVPAEDGWPDGMTIDSEGMLWVAHWNGWQVVRWDPNTGSKLESIKLPAARVTSCAFGGEDLRDLYMTTAKTGLSDEELENQPNAGGLFRIQPGAKGVESFAYAG